jgi:hypothetical protein
MRLFMFQPIFSRAFPSDSIVPQARLSRSSESTLLNDGIVEALLHG